MDIYFIRHGIAVEATDEVDDFDRWLTEQGTQKTLKVAHNLRRLAVEFDIVLTSPLRRAQQTAELLISKGLSENLEIHSALAPGGDLHLWLQWLQAYQSHHPHAQSLAVVGHAPDLGAWAEVLMFGQIFYRMQLKKAGVMALRWPETTPPIGNCQLTWLMPPKCWL